ncbi:MAG: hypothetical protein Q8Q31_05105 [Nanoarchaeota archaeon]|nr:hypothetical protein [Nanoarchaeota archaeon]
MKKVRVLINEKDERAFLEILSRMIERQKMAVNPVGLRKDRKSVFELGSI